MISCQHCGVANTATSKFCSQCGWAIDPAESQSALDKLAEDVAQGQRLFGENRHIEALTVAEAILLSDPDNVPALALKGDCLERSGDLEGALAAYENVVTLKPDSPLDRIRVAQLRRLASAPHFTPPEVPVRRFSLLAGVAAFILLTSAGSALVLANRRDQPVAEAQKIESGVSSVPFSSPAPVPTQSKVETKGVEGATTGNQSPTEPTESGQAEPKDTRNTTGQTNRVATSRRIPYSGSTLPDVRDLNEYRPVTPDVPETLQAPTATSSTDPDPDPVNASEKPKDDKGERSPVIDIRPSQTNPKTVGGSQTRDDNEGTSLIRVARQYFLAGEYDKAAKAYEKAIKLGASTASANHRLAQCYLNLRKRPEALGAYQRALIAYQRMIEQGVGDKKLVGTYIEECKQAIKLLQ